MREGEEGGVDSLHAKVSNDLERDDARSTAIPIYRCILIRDSPKNQATALTIKTVAARFVGRRFANRNIEQ